ncbi:MULTISPECIES: sodium-dependent transporter [unclassified Paenibacillus]|uniref:sodium-dependent transporter n=1 Tax=unclassified Paenibacillus TaxID=185978 RepID=UPI0010464582|nr:MULTISPECIES: sodium-dependent transporter [unclassified Paenibacillus]NIK71113.1 NSS family neurotransmitter:Na+ symporter [Paenibacillus sp. BK720]TCM97166.1 NSS family neurotransmitter:Na+ symporter [Paenibacillus sp. BK033]
MVGHKQGEGSKPNGGDQFSKSGFIFAAIGSAVGLGNMWKFPYITGKYGGAAFFLLFIICLLAVGLPVLMAELTIGKGGRGSVSTSFNRLTRQKGWGAIGFLMVIAPFLILSFYSVVAGWTMYYAVQSFTGHLFNSTDYGGQFGAFIGSWQPVWWQLLAMVLTAAVIIKGVSGGIEKFNKVLIPGLVILLLALVVRALTLGGAGEGVKFFLNPDFSKLSAESALVALGHAFFSLSLGMGTMITYGAYVDRRQSLGVATIAIGLGDLLYAFLAGLIIFPTSFAYGIEPSQGAGLVFVALPAAFAAMPFGSLFGGLFFVLLAFAALTSTVGLLEVPVAYVREKFGWSRSLSVIVITLLVFLVGIPSAVSVGGAVGGLQFGDKTFFDWMDFICSNILLPLGGLIVTIFVGWVWKNAAEDAGLTAAWFRIWLFMVRFIAPILVVLVLLYSTGALNFLF